MQFGENHAIEYVRANNELEELIKQFNETEARKAAKLSKPAAVWLWYPRSPEAPSPPR